MMDILTDGKLNPMLKQQTPKQGFCCFNRYELSVWSKKSLLDVVITSSYPQLSKVLPHTSYLNPARLPKHPHIFKSLFPCVCYIISGDFFRVRELCQCTG